MDSKQIYEILKKKITWLELEPERTLNLTELATSFNVSRNPVTLALTRLHAEKLVLKHGTHFMVSPLSLNRIKDITEIRLVLEVQANIWAMQRITEEEMEKLLNLKKEVLETASESSHTRNVELDFKLHSLLFQATKNIELSEMLELLLSQYLRFFLSVPDLIRDEGLSEAFGIIEAIEKKDEASLRALSEKHIKGSAEQILRAF